MSEATVRLLCFFGVFLLMATWELVRPTRQLLRSKARRWGRNLSLMVLSTLSVRLVIPFTAIGAATYAATHELGLLHGIGIGHSIVGWVVAFVLMDMFIYMQHVIFHLFQPLWRLHLVHHADQDFDVTTGSRFHPVEIVLSMLIKCVVVIAIGAHPTAVLIFEIVLNAAAMFNHANISLPSGLDRAMRWILVTPDMHRVHHSVVPAETNTNFGFNLPWWDRTFRTYQAEPAAGRAGLIIGLNFVQDGREYLPVSLLKMPWTSARGDTESHASKACWRVAYTGIGIFLLCCAYGIYILI